MIEGLVAQAKALASGDIEAQELTRVTLDRIAEGAQLNAFKLVRDAEALAEAEHADQLLAKGERKPLLGVPVAIKDDMNIAGAPTAFGCAGEFPPAEKDSAAVRRLRAAGAVVVGKTNTPEFGQWPFTEGPGFGVTRNPWNPEHTPGGSSGGSAAAVAAGMVSAALGSDGAGSVRIPAAWTHLVGIKPQRGRVSAMPDREAFNGLTVIGPLARTVRDAALLLDVVSGNDPSDKHKASPINALAAAERDPGTLRIAVSTHTAYAIAHSELDPRIEAALRGIADTCAELGHHVEEANPRYGLIGLSFVPRSTAALVDWAGRVGERELDPRTRSNVQTGSALRGPLLAAARAAEPLQHKQIGAIFGAHDVLITPTTATLPPKIGHFDKLSNWDTDKAMIASCPYAWPWNVLGWPGINVPAGRTKEGLPIGVQLLGGEGSEETLISLAAQLESALRWDTHRPAISTEALA